MAQLYSSWFEKWLKTYTDDEPFQDVNGIESQLFGNYSSANSQSEVAMEIYNALRGTDLSLDQLGDYICQIGTIISQTDLRALATQPQSKYNQMFSVVFDSKDGENTLLECHKEDSFAYVYLMVKLLYEILLFTKSTAVRSFAYHQILRNEDILTYLFSIIHKPCTSTETSMSIDIVEAHLLNDPCLERDPLLTKSLDYLRDGMATSEDRNPLNTIGFPPSNYFTCVFDTLFLQMLQSKDLNLRMTGLVLMALSPTIVANNPQLLSEMLINMVGEDDELSFASSVSMAKVLPFLPDVVAMDFLRHAHLNAMENRDNVQRVQSFVALSLGCMVQRDGRDRAIPSGQGTMNAAKRTILAHRMLWMLWSALNGLEKSEIVAEQQCYTMVASTLLSKGNLAARQKLRLEALLYGTKTTPETDSDMVEELSYCLNLMYATGDSTKENVRDSLRLYNALSAKEDIRGPLLYQLVVHQLAVFEKFGDLFLFKHSIKTLPSLLGYSRNYVTILRYVERAFSKLGTSHTRFFLKILEAAQMYLATTMDAHNGHYEHLVDHSDTHFILYTILSKLLRECYICDFEGFKQNIGKINEAITCPDLKILVRPLVQIQNIEKSLMNKRSNFLVQLFYDIVTNETQLCDSFKSLPLYVDYASNKVYRGSKVFKIAVYRQKIGWGLEYRKILSLQIKKLEGTSGGHIYNIIKTSLRLGLYEEALQYIKRASFWVDETLPWFNALHHHSMAELEADPFVSATHRKQCIESLELLRTPPTEQVWNYGLNYGRPLPVLHTWSILQLVFKTAVAHFEAMLAGHGPKVDLVPIFTSLKIQYKVLRWLFSCHETRYILGVYEGMTIVLARLFAMVLTSGSDVATHPSMATTHSSMVTTPPLMTIREYSPTIHPFYTFWAYLQSVYPGARLPFTLEIIPMLPKRLHAHLSATRFLCHKLPENVQTTSMDGSEVPLDTIWQELVINYRCKFGQDEIRYYLRDIPCLDQLYNLLTAISQGESMRIETHKTKRIKKFLEAILKAQIPTPIGILKAYPLPFAAITATLFSKRRRTFDVETIQFQGSIRNMRNDGMDEPSFVRIRMMVDGMDAGMDGHDAHYGHYGGQTLFRETCRVVEKSINHTTLVKIPKDVKSIKFVAMALDANYMPVGVPCDVYISHKVLS